MTSEKSVTHWINGVRAVAPAAAQQLWHRNFQPASRTGALIEESFKVSAPELRKRRTAKLKGKPTCHKPHPLEHHAPSLNAPEAESQ